MLSSNKIVVTLFTVYLGIGFYEEIINSICFCDFLVNFTSICICEQYNRTGLALFVSVCKI